MALLPPPGLRLSVLDQAPRAAGESIGQALRNSIELARLAERLGFHRFWLAEHHGMPALACHSPEVLIGPISAATSRIRVGSGGVMLPHYSPFKVAESFGMLAGLYQGRIDLGVGRAPGSSGRIAQVLQRDRRQPPPDDFPDQVHELLGYLEPDQTEGGPQPALLGSSDQSAQWAAEWGLPYVFADFIAPFGEENTRYYRSRFEPSRWSPKPYVGVAVWVISAETDLEAMRLSYPLRAMGVQLARGRPIAVPSVEEAAEFLAREGVPPEALPYGRRIITGSPATVRQAVYAVAQRYDADEVFAVSIMHDQETRRRSYECIAAAFALAPEESAAASTGVVAAEPGS